MTTGLDVPALSGRRLFLDPDVFLVPTDDTNVLAYAPLPGLLLEVNPSAAAWLEQLRSPGGSPVSPGYETIAAQLRAARVLLDSPPLPRIPKRPRVAPFRPGQVSLFLTGGCNLRCVYCHSRGGERPVTLDPCVASTAVEAVSRTVRSLGQSQFTVHLHGGGEPTSVPELLKRVVGDAERIAARQGLGVRFSLGTNGVMSEAMARWVIQHIHRATVSMDGPPEIQDRQRPLADGSGSHALLRRTLALFDDAGFSYSLRMTVTRESVEQLPRSVRYLIASSRAATIKAEPVFAAGRALSRGLEPPEAQGFVEAFSEADELARQEGRRLVYSGCRPDIISPRFCAAAAGSFCVTPEGAISACYEVVDPNDERAARFFFGHVRPEQDRLDIDEQRRSWLAHQTVDNMAECTDCFAKWHCAGDCLAKTQLGSVAASAKRLHRSDRCIINRELTRRSLLATFRSGADLRASDASDCD